MYFQLKNWLDYYFIVLALACPIVSFSQQVDNWEPVNSPTSQLLNKLSFIDNNRGWVEGEGGTIINTTDGGISWNTLYAAADTFMLDIYFLNENLGWVLFWDLHPPFDSKMLKTTDGGSSWVAELCPGENTFFQTVYFWDSSIGFLAGSDIYKTLDGGDNWYEVNVFDVDTIPPNFAELPVKKIMLYNNQIGFACGGRMDLAGVMWWTKDGGENWAAKGLGPDPINDFHIFDSLNIIGLGGDPEGFFGISKVNTSDGGINWNYTELGMTGVVNAVSFRTPLEGWAVKENKFLLSLDGGSEWVEYNTPGDVLLKDLIFTDSLTGYTVGSEGTILKYNSSSTIIEDLINSKIPNGFTLSQNYPNPFNPKTMIKCKIQQKSFVTLNVYDVLGNEIAILINEEKPFGSYEIEFDATSLPSGLYFYKIQAGNFVATKKMVLMK